MLKHGYWLVVDTTNEAKNQDKIVSCSLKVKLSNQILKKNFPYNVLVIEIKDFTHFFKIKKISDKTIKHV